MLPSIVTTFVALPGQSHFVFVSKLLCRVGFQFMLSGNMGKDFIKWLVCVKITFLFSLNNEVLFACNSFCLSKTKLSCGAKLKLIFMSKRWRYEICQAPSLLAL